MRVGFLARLFAFDFALEFIGRSAPSCHIDFSKNPAKTAYFLSIR